VVKVRRNKITERLYLDKGVRKALENMVNGMEFIDSDYSEPKELNKITHRQNLESPEEGVTLIEDTDGSLFFDIELGVELIDALYANEYDAEMIASDKEGHKALYMILVNISKELNYDLEAELLAKAEEIFSDGYETDGVKGAYWIHPGNQKDNKYNKQFSLWTNGFKPFDIDDYYIEGGVSDMVVLTLELQFDYTGGEYDW
jgi:hypothetical protein